MVDNRAMIYASRIRPERYMFQKVIFTRAQDGIDEAPGIVLEPVDLDAVLGAYT